MNTVNITCYVFKLSLNDGPRMYLEFIVYEQYGLFYFYK